MPNNSFRALPLDSLYELLAESVKNMLSAYDSNEDDMIAFKTIKKQVEMILADIDEKNKEAIKRVDV